MDETKKKTQEIKDNETEKETKAVLKISPCKIKEMELK